MAGQRTAFSKSIGGATLVGVGTLMLYENLAGDVAQLRHVLDANGSDALGVLPAVVLATSQAVRACGFDHQGLMPCLLRMLISFWPPLLVIVGTMLLRNGFTDKVKASPAPNQYFKKNFSKIKTLDVDFTASRSTRR
jgi:putative Mn2+ efflux pump MntP